MHRFILLLWACALLYGPRAALASGDLPTALILPLQSTEFRPAAEAVRDGFLAGGRFQGPRSIGPVRLYPTDGTPEQAVMAYRQAIEDGARLVVGPLTRLAVAAVSQSGLILVPTLALNAADGNAFDDRLLYAFGLSVDAEARQMARLARSRQQRHALLVRGPRALDTRIAEAFRAEWQALGGSLAGEIVLDDTAAPVTWRERAAGSGADLLFFASDGGRAALARPYLPAHLPAYATSQVNDRPGDRARALDLQGVIFGEMPWLAQPDHPAVMIYPRREAPADLTGERLYALGIDAFRVAEMLAAHPDRLALDGVTGLLTLEGRAVRRDLMPVRFQQGRLAPLGAP